MPGCHQHDLLLAGFRRELPGDLAVAITSIRSLIPMISGSSEEIINTAMPFFVSPRIMSWMPALASTSMPRVGSSNMKISASDASHLDKHHFLLVAAAQELGFPVKGVARMSTC